MATSAAFGVPISSLGMLGIVLSVAGFAGFTHFRFQRQGKAKKPETGKREGVSDTNNSTPDEEV